MNKTIFITGTSSGIGKATVEYFLQKGWNVVATMKKKDDQVFTPHSNLLVLELDVINFAGISECIKLAIERFSKVDVVVNNAGYGLIGPVENAKTQEIVDQFNTNLLGLILVTREFIPQFKSQGGGTFVNISSMMGKITLPFFSLYSSTKFGVEGFSEGIRYELGDDNIKVRLIEPGTIKTNFFKDAVITLQDISQNQRFQRIIQNLKQRGNSGEDPIVVAKMIYNAATDTGNRLRYVPDKTAKLLLFLRSMTFINLFQLLIRKTVG
jgi:NAD(P)-dependent dehydrogenase (short-subunit alcohol dehydrogenase family)